MMKQGLLILLLFFAAFSLFAQETEMENHLGFGRNNVTFSMSDIVFHKVSFRYEHVFGDNGKISLVIPLSLSFGDQKHTVNDFYNNSEYFPNISGYLKDYSTYYIGLGFNLYPLGQGVFRMFFGPEFRMGGAHYKEDYVYDYWIEDYYPYQLDDVKYFQTSFLMNIGAIYEPVTNLIMSINMGVGYRNTYEENRFQMLLSPSFNFGYRF